MFTRRNPRWNANRIYGVRSHTVLTVKKSSARIPWVRRPEELASGRKFPIRVSAQRAWTRRRKRLRASLGRVLPPISWRELVVGRGGLAWKRFS
jgi:hypothetical protein